jgi:hypothetical protein
MRPHDGRGGMRTSYTIGKLQVVAENQEEIWNLIQAMQQWANGTFQPTVMERQEDGPLVVSPIEEEKPPELEDLDIDPLTGLPR